MRDLNELQRLAEQGHNDSQFMLGFKFAKGQGVPRDIGMAKAWLERAAMANDPRAQYYLGELYGDLGKTDPRTAFSQMAFWWGKSANHPYWETSEGMDGRAISMRRLVWLHMHSGFENASAGDTLRLLEELTNKYSSPRSAIELGIVIAAGSFMPLTSNLGNTPVQRDIDKGLRLIDRGVLIIENGSNDIDYNLYSVIADIYLSRDGNGPRSGETVQKGIHFKKRALERSTGVNEDVVINLRNEIATLERELGQPTGPMRQEPIREEHKPQSQTDPAMAAKFAKFHEYFDGLDMEGKQNFIKDLDQKLQTNPNAEYKAFLMECVAKYTAANREIQSRAISPPPPSIVPDRPVADPIPQYNDYDEAPPQFEPPYYPDEHDNLPQHDHYQEDYQDHHHASGPLVGDYDAPSYTDRIHSYGASGTFLFGTLLITLGGLLLPVSLGLHLNIEIGGHQLGYLGYAVVLIVLFPIIGLWLVYSASKNPRAPEKSLTALTLFRITAFIHLGVIAAVATVVAVRFGADAQAMFGLSLADTPLHLVFLLSGLRQLFCM